MFSQRFQICDYQKKGSRWKCVVRRRKLNITSFCPMSASGFDVPLVFARKEMRETCSCSFPVRVAMCFES